MTVDELMAGETKTKNYGDLLSLTGPGMIMEFGVASGRTINIIAGHVSPRVVYGFDWFKGLPEDWVPGQPKGTFACPIPTVEPNVDLIVGRFEETLEPFLTCHQGSVAFAHMDADLYSSTSYVLERLPLVKGSILAFDEIRIELGFEHERDAFQHYIDKTGTKWEYLGESRHYCSAAFRML